MDHNHGGIMSHTPSVFVSKYTHYKLDMSKIKTIEDVATVLAGLRFTFMISEEDRQDPIWQSMLPYLTETNDS